MLGIFGPGGRRKRFCGGAEEVNPLTTFRFYRMVLSGRIGGV
jgi:hypothetical protein